ncbi:hypothetical protein G7Y89_g3671 [Cudoniella acicularis]|uniref:Phytanoyl-CoA dioxygenase n=1 Tax=Cudoniella acicularis TaxID=354080 RepID=A0A8H4RS54_9HELO|nr:hypothetical protein G7Y89_g3671 [Cudoniella acicularis]
MGSLSQATATAPDSDFTLTETQKAQFLERGYVKIPACFTRAQAADFTSKIWTRLGKSPTDKSTWGDIERINMAWHLHVPAEKFAPKAWSAMCQLLGGEDKIQEGMFRSWSDGFIVNFGRDEFDGMSKEDMEKSSLRDLDGWHNDGDFFVHFLDSPEQALLVIPLWSDIEPHGGGTALACDGIKHIAQYMVPSLLSPLKKTLLIMLKYEHPEGVTPWMRSLNDPTHSSYEGREFWQALAADKTKISDDCFVEATGQIGDVYLLHPFMLHSASRNYLRIPRIITNPPVSLKEPFKLWREDGNYSLVEQKTLKDLGKPEGIKDWKITKERMGWVSNRVKRQEKMREQERLRLGGV